MFASQRAFNKINTVNASWAGTDLPLSRMSQDCNNLVLLPMSTGPGHSCKLLSWTADFAQISVATPAAYLLALQLPEACSADTGLARQLTYGTLLLCTPEGAQHPELKACEMCSRSVSGTMTLAARLER